MEKTFRAIALTAVFALPFLALYVANSMFFPFISGKNFAFRILVEIATGAWLFLALLNPLYRPKKSWLLWAFGAFVVVMAVADAFGVYPFKSFWSNYERMEGWVTLAHLFAYFVVAVSVLNTDKLWRAWWHTSLGVSVIVAIIGLFQLAGQININQSSLRLDARLGNATYAGIYMFFHIFMAGLFLARAWVEKGKGKRLGITLLYGSIMALDAFILFFTATRGAILGLVGGIALAGLILIFLAPRSRVAWRAGTLIAVVILLVGSFWMVRDAAWVQRIEPLYRLSTIVEEGYPVARLMNIQMAFQGFKERPLLGWGQENYAAVFDKYYDPNMYAQEQWFDRTHNIIFDWLIAGGILGLIGYLSLHVFALLMIWRSSGFAPYERAILTGLWAGYFFYLIFTFDNITSYILFVGLLAYLTVRAHAGEPPIAPEAKIQKSYAPVVAAVAIILTWGTAWVVNAQMMTANRTLIRALSPQSGGPAKNLEYFTEALSYSRAGTQEIREQFAQAAMSSLAMEGIPADLKQRFLQAAVTALTAQIEESPLNARGPYFLGVLFNRSGALEQGKQALEKAHSLSPQKQGILFELGMNAQARGATEEAIAYFKQAYELAPAYNEARFLYAAALIRAKKDVEADALLKPLIESNAMANERVAAAYVERGHYPKIIDIWSRYVAAHPNEAQPQFLLAAAYFESGNIPAARRTLEALKINVPSSAAQVDAFLKQLQTAN